MKMGINPITISVLTLLLSICIFSSALAAEKIQITDVKSDPKTVGIYEVIYDPGLEVGVKLWHDREYVFTNVPKEYEGMPFIKNNIYPVNDKGDDPLLPEYKLTFNLANWGSVYVAWDARPGTQHERTPEMIERPKGWLSGKDYIKMDEPLVWADNDGDNENPVYRSSKPVKGEFTTYGYTASCHYIVFVGDPVGASVSLGNQLATCWARIKALD